MAQISLVDDDIDSRKLLEKILIREDHTVAIFSSAEEFLEAAPSHTDLFLIDINLGGLSGDELCTLIKSQPASAESPVIIISAHPEIERISHQACADAFLAKPFQRNKLVDLIASLLK